MADIINEPNTIEISEAENRANLTPQPQIVELCTSGNPIEVYSQPQGIEVAISANEIDVFTTPNEVFIEVGSQGPAGPAGAPGIGVPSGGTTGQALIKASNSNYDTEWVSITLNIEIGAPVIGGEIFDVLHIAGDGFSNPILGQNNLFQYINAGFASGLNVGDKLSINDGTAFSPDSPVSIKLSANTPGIGSGNITPIILVTDINGNYASIEPDERSGLPNDVIKWPSRTGQIALTDEILPMQIGTYIYNGTVTNILFVAEDGIGNPVLGQDNDFKWNSELKSLVAGASGIATGNNSVSLTGGQALAEGSIAMGQGSCNEFAINALALIFGQAQAEQAFAMGENGTANGSASFAINGTANGDQSFSFVGLANGTLSMAVCGGTSEGNNSFAHGFNTAYSYAEVALGGFSTPYTPASTTSFVGTDRLFALGNGTFGNESDAIIVLKNGETVINSDSTPLTLHSPAFNLSLKILFGGPDGFEDGTAGIYTEDNTPLVAYDSTNGVVMLANSLYLSQSLGLIVSGTDVGPSFTGDVTMNTIRGRVNFANGMNSLTVTNSLATLNSTIIPTLYTVDSDMISPPIITRGDGFFTMTAPIPPRDITGVGFVLFN